ncbi:MAG: metallophosphatase family protein [Thermoanaerobaculia bacterium]|nr:metallophosphatase family protein [Thermoanaerobaculia bacterium]
MRVGVISDTHGLLRPEAVAALRGSELILHVGDVDSPGILDELSMLAPVRAVRGNVDYGVGQWGRWAAEMPTTREVVLGRGADRTRIFMVHRLQDLRHDPAAVGQTAVLFGHSHKPESFERNRVLYLNPGSAGPRRFSLPVGIARLEVEGGTMRHELITLDV